MNKSKFMPCDNFICIANFNSNFSITSPSSNLPNGLRYLRFAVVTRPKRSAARKASGARCVGCATDLHKPISR